MQTTGEIDTKHLDKLQKLEKFKKNISELISLAIDEVYNKQKATELNHGRKAYHSSKYGL